MKNLILLLLGAASFAIPGSVSAQTDERIPIIFDTDFVMPPADDSLALMLALQSPEIEILGITTVAGNDSLERATSDVLRMLEIAGQPGIPVYRGAPRSLLLSEQYWRARTKSRWLQLVH